MRKSETCVPGEEDRALGGNCEGTQQPTLGPFPEDEPPAAPGAALGVLAVAAGDLAAAPVFADRVALKNAVDACIAASSGRDGLCPLQQGGVPIGEWDVSASPT